MASMFDDVMSQFGFSLASGPHGLSEICEWHNGPQKVWTERKDGGYVISGLHSGASAWAYPSSADRAFAKYLGRRLAPAGTP